MELELELTWQGRDLGWEDSPTKWRATSILWSRDKSKTFSLYFRKVYGPKTWQGYESG